MSILLILIFLKEKIIKLKKYNWPFSLTAGKKRKKVFGVPKVVNAFIEMTPVTSTPSSSIDFTTDKFSEWEVNISKAEETSWTNYTAIDTAADDTVKLSI